MEELAKLLIEFAANKGYTVCIPDGIDEENDETHSVRINTITKEIHFDKTPSVPTDYETFTTSN